MGPMASHIPFSTISGKLFINKTKIKETLRKLRRVPFAYVAYLVFGKN